MSKDKKLNNLLGMEDYTEKDIIKKTKTTKRTEVAKDILEKADVTGKDVFIEDKMKNKQEVATKKLNNLISLDDFSEKETLKDAKKTKHTDVAKDVLNEKETGKDVFVEDKMKNKEEIEKKGLNNLISLDNFSEKEAKKTKRTDVAKDVLQEKAKLGSGERFKKLSGELKEKGAKDPDALAAYIGRKKYGKAKFQKLAAKGKK